MKNIALRLGGLSKSKFFFLFLSTATLFLTSCSEEILPSTDGKKTAIVFATLDIRDTIHFVKITKAFYGGGNQVELAKIPDSSYFKQVDAVVKEYSNGALTRTFILKDTIISNKEEGAFYAPEQKLYYFETTSAPLIGNGTTKYQFEADINNGEFKVTSERIELVHDMVINTPSTTSEIKFEKDNNTNAYKTASFTFNAGSSKKIEAKLYIDFEEYNSVNNVDNLKYSKTIEWKIGEIESDDIPASGAVSASAEGETFYNLIKDNVSSDSDIIKRKFKGMRILINGASTELQKYLLLNKPSSSLSQSKTSFTNLTVSNGHRVVGIFASRSFQDRYRQAWVYAGGSSYYACINTNSMQELCTGTITGGLAFCSDNPTHNTKNFFCN